MTTATARHGRFERLASVLQIGFSVSVCVLLVNVILHGLESTPVSAWLPKAISGTGFLEDNRRRVADAAEELKSDPHPLAAVIGISNVREGINLEIMSEAAAAPDWRFLGLGGAGLGVEDISEHAAVLLKSDLRPRLVIIGFGLHQLVDSKPAAAAATRPGGDGQRAAPGF